MSEKLPWWHGMELVHIVGHSAYGGAVPIILGMMRVAGRMGLKPVLLATHPDVVAAARHAGADVWEFRGITREPRPVHDLATTFRLAVALRRRGIHLVHTHTSKGGMVGRLAAWLARCDVIIHHTHGFYHSGLKPGLRKRTMILLERAFARLDDIQVFINTPEYATAVQTGMTPRTKARLVFNGVAEPPHGADRAGLRAGWGIGADAPLIGTVCRIDFEQKGLDVGLLAFALVTAAEPSARWVIAGEGADRERLSAMVGELGLSDRVLILGHVEGAGALHTAFDVTFAPSWREGQSVTVIEAMACGTPAVATLIDGNVDLIEDGRSGWLVRVGDAQAMAEALLEAIRSPEVARARGVSAESRYRELFTMDAFEQRIETLYREVLETGTFR